MSARKVKAVIRAINEMPGYLDQLYEGLQAIERLRDKGHQLYKSSHWGRAGGRKDSIGSVPDYASGVVELGVLHKVEYITVKGSRGTSDIYVHSFDFPKPILAYAADGSGLVIVRGRSRYRVTSHGIEG